MTDNRWIDLERQLRPRRVVAETADAIGELLHDPVVTDLVEQLAVLRLAYTAPDGPRVVPVNYGLVDGRFRIWTAPGAPKVTALRADPRVALTLDAADDPPHALLVRGRATVELVDGVPDDYVAVMRERADPLPFERWLTETRGLHPTMARIEVTPTWATVLDFQTRFPQAIDDRLHRPGAPT